MSSDSITGINSIIWYENTDGAGQFTNQHIVTNTANNVLSIDVNDIDGDGDMDIASSSSSGYDVSWFENLDGMGNFGTANFIQNQITGIVPQLALTDMDNDGDMDIVAIWNSNQVIRWFENLDGSGNFTTSTSHEIAAFLGADYKFHLSDLDYDGDVDIVASTYDFQYGKLELYKNLGTLGNEISGTVRADLSQNGCQSTDPLIGGVLLTTSNGTDNFSTFTDIDGSFQLPVNLGAFTTLVQQFPSYYNVSPVSHDTSFAASGSSDTSNFCLTPNAEVDDLTISILPLNEPRPGFDSSYMVVYKNVGSTAISGSLAFQYDNSKMQFTNASETITLETANTLNFDFSEILPFQTRNIQLNFQVFTPPTTSINDTMLFAATVSPVVSDATQNDNGFQLQQLVIGSYDPNDITCLQGAQVLIDDADEYLYYLIRFQNTGTADAINVKVEQTIDDRLDWTTMQIEHLSHRGTVSIANGTDFIAQFHNIHLPSSNINEPESHGYIAYRIKPQDNITVGEMVDATAEIYFDFNPPIVTNTTHTTFVESLSVRDTNIQQLKIYPNPTNHQLFIENTGSSILQSITITHLDGRTLLTQHTVNHQRHSINMSVYQAGIYFVSVKTTQGTQTFKIIKN